MNPQFLIEKLAANATDKAWSQAYSTLNFYVAVSVFLEQEEDKPVTQIGKELLERLQREYFSLDEKSIENIKKAVESTISTINDTVTYSLVLVTNNLDTLYIVTAGNGIVTIKRGEKYGVIAEGQHASVQSFTGPLHDKDILLVQTDDFAKKLPLSVISPFLQTTNITELSEHIAPLLHADPTGAEAAILLQYINPEAPTTTDSIDDDTLREQTSVDDPTKDPATDEYSEESVTDLLTETPKKLPFSILNFSVLTKGLSTVRTQKKLLLGIIIIALLVFLVGSILIRNIQEKSADNTAAIEQAVSTATGEYEEGVGLEPLNRPLALEKFIAAKDLLTNIKQQYPNDGNIEKVDKLLTKVEEKLSQLSSGETVENGEITATAQDLDISEIQTVTVQGGTIIVTNKSNTLVTVTTNGDVDDSYELDTQTIIDSVSNNNFAYVLTGSGVLRVDLGNGNDNKLFELDSARQAIDIFGSNIYLLNSSDRMVEKYSPSRYQSSDYMENSLEATPVSLGIDGSIYVVLDTGKIQKYTRGVPDTYTLTGTQGSVSKNSLVFSAEEYTYVYILDRTNQRILITSKSGEVKQEFSWDIIGNAVDFSVDEGAKKIYIATPDALHSFTF